VNGHLHRGAIRERRLLRENRDRQPGEILVTVIEDDLDANTETLEDPDA
jgi:hypothetical protein